MAGIIRMHRHCYLISRQSTIWPASTNQFHTPTKDIKNTRNINDAEVEVEVKVEVEVEVEVEIETEVYKAYISIWEESKAMNLDVKDDLHTRRANVPGD